VLTISGERKFEKEEKKRKFHRVERGYGTFVRSFTLPDDADANKVRLNSKTACLRASAKSEHAKPNNRSQRRLRIIATVYERASRNETRAFL